MTTQFIRDSSPPEDIDPHGAESDTPTELDLDDFVVVGGKRTPASNCDPRYADAQNTTNLRSNCSIYPGV